MRRLGRILMVMVVVLGTVGVAQGLTGSGTEEDPWLIQSLGDFDEFASDANYWDDYTRLETDVNLAGRVYDRAVIGWGSGYFFEGVPFTGVFDGNDHRIENLTIDDGGDLGINYLGLFGYIMEEGAISNVQIEDGSVICDDGHGYVGGLVGRNAGNISKCYFTGDVSGGSSSHYVGGLVGFNFGSISNSYSIGDVNGIGYVGGLVGATTGVSNISKCYSTGNVRGDEYVGGFVGHNHGNISNCYSIGDVNGIDGVGGLAGKNDGLVSNCYSTGSVSGNDHVGGLMGDGYWRGTTNCFWDVETSGVGVPEGYNCGATGKTTAQMQTAYTFRWWASDPVWTIDEGVDYPRLVWENRLGELISTIPLAGTGTQEDPWRIRSLADFDDFAATPSCWDDYTRLETDVNLAGRVYTTAVIAPDMILDLDINYDGPFFSGVFDGNDHKILNLMIDDGGLGHDFLGLFGQTYLGEIRNLALEGVSVNGTGAAVGSLAGDNRGSISNCYSIGDVNGIENVGAFVGSIRSSGTISNCYSIGNANGIDNIGGFVGSIRSSGTISNCYFMGDVSGGSNVGGLVGVNDGDVYWCHANGTVTGETYVGGLIGYHEGTINSCYSVGEVTGSTYVGGLVGLNEDQSNCVMSLSYAICTVTGDNFVGGLVGKNESSIIDCYAKGPVTGTSYVGGLLGYNWYEDDDYEIIQNCYAAGKVTGISNVGGLIGVNHEDDSIELCFWDTEASGQDLSDGGFGLPTYYMKRQYSFFSWDFINVWAIGENQTYPYLRTVLASDINKDRITNFLDLCIVAEQWMREE